MTRAGFALLLAQHAHAAEDHYPSLCEKQTSPHMLRHTGAMAKRAANAARFLSQ
jgi:hypothetical protein